jgi:leucyl-tRNA synthetase
LEREKPWTEEGVQGVHRFLRRVWALFITEQAELSARIVPSGGDPEVTRILHRTIKEVTHDIENLQFNTAISRMMEFVNAGTKAERIDRGAMEKFTLVLSPFAPHIAEELWERLGHANSLAYEPWPEYDPSLLVQDTVLIPVQINGKLRDTLELPVGLDQSAILAAASAGGRPELMLGPWHRALTVRRSS